MNVELTQNNQVIMTGHPADVKEKVQDMFEEKYGFYPDFQESDIEDGDDYYIYLHSEAYEDLTDSENEQLEKMNITEDPESTTEVLKKLFNIDFKIV